MEFHCLLNYTYINWFIRERAFIEIWSTREVWGARKFFSRGICLLTSWACTIGIWSTLAQLNLIGQIYQLCYNIRWYHSILITFKRYMYITTYVTILYSYFLIFFTSQRIVNIVQRYKLIGVKLNDEFKW